MKRSVSDEPEIVRL